MKAKLRVALALFLAMALPATAQTNDAQAAMLADLKRTLEEAEMALQSSPSSLSVLSSAGNASLFLGHYGKSVEYFRRMIELDPKQDAPHWRLGIAYYFNEQYAESAKQFAKYHAYDARDRENGIWKFLGDAKLGGLEKARAEMLPYTEFDREPFPALYDLYAGRITVDDFAAGLQQRGVTGNPRAMFFAHYYRGLYEELQGQHEPALAHLAKAIALFTPDEANASGPGYMWQVARVHREWLQKHSGAAGGKR